jgi:hypothetical protein
MTDWIGEIEARAALERAHYDLSLHPAEMTDVERLCATLRAVEALVMLMDAVQCQSPTGPLYAAGWTDAGKVWAAALREILAGTR